MTRRAWIADGKTGGTATDLDGKGNDGTAIVAGDVAWVFSDVSEPYKCISDGATADGDSVIEPISDVLTAAGDANLRWHKVSNVVFVEEEPAEEDMIDGVLYVVVEE